ncbi:hypothetical protein Gotur_001859 [Gossypium turneri]
MAINPYSIKFYIKASALKLEKGKTAKEGSTFLSADVGSLARGCSPNLETAFIIHHMTHWNGCHWTPRNDNRDVVVDAEDENGFADFDPILVFAKPLEGGNAE